MDITIQPGRYLVGDPASFVANDVWDELRQAYQAQNANDRYDRPVVDCRAHAVIFILAADGRATVAQSGHKILTDTATIVVMPIELVTVDVDNLTKLRTDYDYDEQSGETSHYAWAFALDISEPTTVHIEYTGFTVGDQYFDLT